jgi:mannan endo-1,4-beta-mannosidase
MTIRSILFTFLVASVGSVHLACQSARSVEAPDVRLVDRNAEPQTRALFTNLDRLRVDGTLFGHQDDLAYGVHWIREDGRSDVREAAGSYPAVYGWELGDLELGADANLDGVNFRDMQRWILEGYQRGGVITIGWHMNNPASGGNAWDTTRAIHTILPGGVHHETYRGWLDRFAEFNAGLIVPSDGSEKQSHHVPIIFRPFHEMTGSWFWWGRDSVTPEEYRDLWRFTVRYLRDERGVHNLLWAYSTDVFQTEEQYLEHYPGDEYVDILGFDDYQALRVDDGWTTMAERLRSLVRMAESRGKIPALTETGLETVPVDDWWTNRLLRAIDADDVTRRIAYVLLWRNANRVHDRADHFYAPYAGHSSADDFRRFREHPSILFEDDLPNLYQ